MKNLILFGVFAGCFQICFAQDFKPKMYNDTLVYKTDTLESHLQKVRLKKYDDMFMHLVKWRNGYWETAMRNDSYPQTIYVPDYIFVQDDPRYREELAKYSVKAKKANTMYLKLLIKKYGRDNGYDYYYKQPFIGLSSTTVFRFLGSPDKINTTRTRYGTSEQWIYYSGIDNSIVDYYYFKNGKLEAIQH